MTTCQWKVGDKPKDGTGTEVEIVAVLDRPLSRGYTILGIRDGDVATYMPDGRFRSNGMQHPFDLLPPTPETEKMTVWVWVWAGAFSLYTVANTNEAVARDEARRAESLMPNCEPVRVEIDVLKRPRGRTPS